MYTVHVHMYIYCIAYSTFPQCNSNHFIESYIRVRTYNYTVHKITAGHRSISDQNQNALAKQLIVGHNDLTIRLNWLRGQCSGLYMHYYNLATCKVIALYCQKLKMVCQSVRAWHSAYFVH